MRITNTMSKDSLLILALIALEDYISTFSEGNTSTFISEDLFPMYVWDRLSEEQQKDLDNGLKEMMTSEAAISAFTKPLDETAEGQELFEILPNGGDPDFSNAILNVFKTLQAMEQLALRDVIKDYLYDRI